VSPRKEDAFKHPRLTVTSVKRGLQGNLIQEETTQLASSKSADAEWQAHQRPRRPHGLPDPLAWPLQNRFAGLLEEAVEEDPPYSQEYPKLPFQPQENPCCL